jgi:hypothetical protein
LRVGCVHNGLPMFLGWFDLSARAGWPEHPVVKEFNFSAPRHGPGQAAFDEFKDEIARERGLGEKEVRKWFFFGRVLGAGEVMAARAVLVLGVVEEVAGPVAVFFEAEIAIFLDAGFEFGGFLFGDGIVAGIFAGETVLEQDASEIRIFGVDMPEEFAERFFFGGVVRAGEGAAAGAVFERGAEFGEVDGFVFVLLEAELGVVGDGAL